MVGYWDTSAVVPLLVKEDSTALRKSQYVKSTGMITWWGTRIEAVSALCRRNREGILAANALESAMARLRVIESQWSEVSPSEALRTRSERLLRIHPLRSADAL